VLIACTVARCGVSSQGVLRLFSFETSLNLNQRNFVVPGASVAIALETRTWDFLPCKLPLRISPWKFPSDIFCRKSLLGHSHWKFPVRHFSMGVPLGHFPPRKFPLEVPPRKFPLEVFPRKFPRGSSPSDISPWKFPSDILPRKSLRGVGHPLEVPPRTYPLELPLWTFHPVNPPPLFHPGSSHSDSSSWKLPHTFLGESPPPQYLNILQTACANFTQFTTKVQLGVKMKWLDFEEKRSKVKVTTRPVVVKNHPFKNAPFWLTVCRQNHLVLVVAGSSH